jgi:hypothetical protein
MNYHFVSQQVANEINLPLKVVESAYRSYWQFIKDKIQSLPLKEDLSEEDFEKLRTNFNIPSLGKLSCTYDRMVNVKKRFEYIKNIRN